ncbi:glycosyltransferase family 2 protein [Pedobacter paludis]|uniref:Glycosyltransferase 2-like domain-containing protein n=1 Tax=Pedobacter paludis TaxID=2203212 RepID=A0A317F4N1_9SPHI|nr:glycosyltransferase family 2 protein [Pedobacter paludis]PWS33283.1 hypothetical protein DF947_01270 [Pedobacter paludis]
MKKFKPYSIQHLQLNGLDSFKPLKSNYYLVLWWKNFPLGHIWLTEEDFLSDNISLDQKVIEAIQPTIDYYSAIPIHAGNTSNWRDYFLNREKLKLEQLFDKIIPIKDDNFLSDKKLSVVICTRNRPQAIDDCVQALLNSNDKDFELIVIDNAPDDDSTEKVIKKYPEIKYFKEPRKGLDIARNTGARLASNEIVAYTDDDVIVEPNWTSQLKLKFNDRATMAVTGLVIPISLNTKAQFTFEKAWGFNKGYLPQLYDEHYFNKHVHTGVPVWDIGAGANMAFRREIFDLIGWFDERLDVGASGCSGDSEFWYRILAEGYHCRYYPELFVYHKHREESSSLKHQIFSYMRGQVSSVLVQYENYHHQGELYRLKKILPNYYSKRIFGDLLHLRLNSLLDTFNEIHGCISGWLYYRKHRNVQRKGNILFLKSLSRDVVMDENTLVSIIIPCYNHSKYLTKAINSVLNQSYKNVEIVVVDDGSTDNTVEVCKAYNVKYIRTNRVGLSAARNTGFCYSTGQFLVFLDADDYLFPDALQININYFANNKSVAFVSGAHDKVDDNGDILSSAPQIEKWAENYEGLLHGNYIAMEGTVMYRRDLFYTFFFDPQLKACEDYDINLNITRHFTSITHSEKIAAYRIHDYNMSADKGLMLKNAIKVLERQKRNLRNDKELNAFNSGIESWKAYYKN